MKQILQDLSLAEIQSLVAELGEQKFRAAQIYRGVMLGKRISDMSDLSKSLRAKLSERFEDEPVKVREVFTSADGTEKYLFELADGNIIEGVLMSYKYGNTQCVSTQVGCRMNCAFCASGLNGLIRNLTAGEILAQILVVNARRGGTPEKRAVTNVVLMGSGEPLDNYDNVREFVRLLTAEDCFGLSERSVTLSTSGLADGIRRLADDGSRMTLSVSLHATTDEARSAIMPVNRRYPISEVVSAARYYFEKTGRRVTFEYTLISGVNDSPADAERLTALLRGFPAHVNLIRLNAVEGSSLKATTLAAAARFAALLTKKGLPATVRRSLGSDIEGACGQLKRRYTGEDGE